MTRQTIEEIVKGLMPEAPPRVTAWARRYGCDCHLAWVECDQADIMGSMLVLLHTQSQIIMTVLCECIESSYSFEGAQKIKAVEEALELAYRWSFTDGITLCEVSKCMSRLARRAAVGGGYESDLCAAARAMLVFATPSHIDHGALVRGFIHNVICARVGVVKMHSDVSDVVVNDVVRRANVEFCNRIRRLVSWDALAFGAMSVVRESEIVSVGAFWHDLN